MATTPFSFVVPKDNATAYSQWVEMRSPSSPHFQSLEVLTPAAVEASTAYVVFEGSNAAAPAVNGSDAYALRKMSDGSRQRVPLQTSVSGTAGDAYALPVSESQAFRWLRLQLVDSSFAAVTQSTAARTITVRATDV